MSQTIKVHDGRRARAYYVTAETDFEAKAAVRSDQWQEALDPAGVTEEALLTCTRVVGTPTVNAAIGMAIDEERDAAICALKEQAEDLLGGYTTAAELGAFQHGMQTMIRALEARRR